MAPPGEQLIRDYLNRLSAGARGQLGPDDRRALVDRAREIIVSKIESTGPRTALEVGRLLLELGDPATLIQQERERVGAAGGELPEPPANRNPITKLLRRDPGEPRGSSWRWPIAAGRTDLQFRLLDGGLGDRDANGSNGSDADGAASNDGLSASGESRPHVPRQARDPDWFFQALGGGSQSQSAEVADADADNQPLELDPPGRIRPPWPLASAAKSTTTNVDVGDPAGPGDAAPTILAPAWQLTTRPDRTLPQQIRAAMTAAVSWYRRRPLEASAVVILGLGGAIFPPVWLLGAAVALPSRVWDGRDKWLGLASPLLLTIVAGALGIMIAGHVSVSRGVHEGWIFAVTGSRIAAVLGASYLCWRSVYGRRPPAAPPWNRAHKVG